MEQEILNQLVAIKVLLVWVVVLLSVLVLGKTARQLSKVILNWRANKNNTIREMSIKMFDRAEFDDLVEYCEEKLEKQPNNATAIYWLARGYLELEKYDLAKSYLLKLRQLEPSWEEEYVSPFLERIDEQH